MEKQRSIKVLSVVALIVAVLGLTVAFAALSETLNITGTGSVKGNTTGETTWNVHFSDSADIIVEGNLNKTELQNNLDIKTTSIDVGAVSMKAPGDKVTYEFTVVNDGTESAKLDSASLKEKSCSGNGDSASADVSLICGTDFEYTYWIQDKNGADVVVEEGENLTLQPGDTATVTLVVGYKSSATELPKNDVSITNLGVILNFVQAD